MVAWADLSSADFLKRADEERAKSKFQEATQDYDRALAQDPKLTKAYMGRGIVKWEQGDPGEAMNDFSKVIELDPNNAEAFERRASMKTRTKDREGALQDYDRALALDPKRASAYAARADEYRDAGNLEAALSDYTRAIEIDRYNEQTYFSRSILFYQEQRWAEAAADLRKRIPLMTNEVGYTRLYLWVVRAHIGEQKKGANQELLRYFTNAHKKPPPPQETPAETVNPDPLAYRTPKFVAQLTKPPTDSRSREWTETIAKYLCGKTDENTLLAADLPPAVGNGRYMTIRPSGYHSCDAWYFTGIKALEQRNEAKAAECFQKCLTAYSPQVAEMAFARAELNAMEKNPKN